MPISTSEPPDVDKRRYPRILVRLPAVYRSSNLTIDAFVSNISQGGLNLDCTDVDIVGTEGEVQITLPGQTDALRLQGKVIWSDRSTEQQQGMGFCFDSLNRDHRLALANFLIARYYNT
jgi:uncharacterized protein (TIGR02266 family)